MRNPFELEKETGLNDPSEIYGYRPYLVAFSATWAAAMYGYDSAFIGGTIDLDSFQRSFGLEGKSSSEVSALSSNIVSTFQAGAFFGCILGFLGAERFGQKLVIIASGCVFIVGVILQMIGKLGLLCKSSPNGGRALGGLGIGATSTIIPAYISECSPAMIRGRLVGFFEMMLQMALVVGFWVNYGVNRNISPATNKQWHIPVAIQFIPAGLLLLFMPFAIESPRWLVSKGRIPEARKALSWVRHLPEHDEYINTEMDRIETSIRHELEVSGGRRNTWQMFRELGAPGLRRRVAIGVLLMLLQNLTGINAINYYSPTILRSIGFSGTSVGLLATGVYGLVKMLATVVFMVFIVDRFGRRSALLVGAVGAMVAMYYLAAYSSLSNSFSGNAPSDGGSRAALAMIYIYAIFYGFSWNGIPWIIASEVLPNRIRTLGMMCAVCMQWLAQFMVVYSLPYMIDRITYGTFVFFGTCTVVAFLFAYFFVPETKGVSLEDMDLLFDENAPILARAARKNYDSVKSVEPASVAIQNADDKMEDKDVQHIDN